jgi:hypothetical protein
LLWKDSPSVCVRFDSPFNFECHYESQPIPALQDTEMNLINTSEPLLLTKKFRWTAQVVLGNIASTCLIVESIELKPNQAHVQSELFGQEYKVSSING